MRPSSVVIRLVKKTVPSTKERSWIPPIFHIIVKIKWVSRGCINNLTLPPWTWCDLSAGSIFQFILDFLTCFRKHFSPSTRKRCVWYSSGVVWKCVGNSAVSFGTLIVDDEHRWWQQSGNFIILNRSWCVKCLRVTHAVDASIVCFFIIVPRCAPLWVFTRNFLQMRGWPKFVADLFDKMREFQVLWRWVMTETVTYFGYMAILAVSIPSNTVWAMEFSLEVWECRLRTVDRRFRRSENTFYFSILFFRQHLPSFAVLAVVLPIRATEFLDDNKTIEPLFSLPFPLKSTEEEKSNWIGTGKV